MLNSNYIVKNIDSFRVFDKLFINAFNILHRGIYIENNVIFVTIIINFYVRITHLFSRLTKKKKKS